MLSSTITESQSISGSISIMKYHSCHTWYRWQSHFKR